MALLFALLCACTYGTADYFGGRATRHVPAAVVTLAGQTAGMVILGSIAVASGVPAPPAADWWWGGLAGVFGSTGLLFFYKSMSTGHMTTAAPVTAMVNALIPVAFGFAIGERPGVLALVAVPIVLVAVALVSGLLEQGRGRAPFAVVAQAATGGAFFGLILVALHQTSDTSGVWPVLVMRFFSTPYMVAVVLATRQRPGGLRSRWRVVVASGVLDSLANWFYVLAVREGMLSVVAMVVTLYPAVTIVLATGVDHERLRRPQIIGLVLAGSALAMITLS